MKYYLNFHRLLVPARGTRYEVTCKPIAKILGTPTDGQNISYILPTNFCTKSVPHLA